MRGYLVCCYVVVVVFCFLKWLFEYLQVSICLSIIVIVWSSEAHNPSTRQLISHAPCLNPIAAPRPLEIERQFVQLVPVSWTSN